MMRNASVCAGTLGRSATCARSSRPVTQSRCMPAGVWHTAHRRPWHVHACATYRGHNQSTVAVRCILVCTTRQYVCTVPKDL
eukprot:2626043-Prymnesium_polylepis.2